MPRRVRVLLYAVVIGLLAIAVGKIVLDQRSEPAATQDGVRDGLEEFLAPWDEAVRNQEEKPATVVVVGDSISEGTALAPPLHRTRFSSQLQERLRASQDVSGGAGRMAPYSGDRLSPDDTVRTGPPAQERSFDAWGAGSRALLMPTDAVLTYPKVDATSVRVWYGQTALFGGQAQVLVDGQDMTDQGTLSNGQKSGPTLSSTSIMDIGGLFWSSPALEPGEHTVQVRSSAPNSYFVHSGVEFFDGDETSGIRVVDAAHSGATARHFADDASALGHWAEVGAHAPQLILVNIGSNPETDYASALSLMVDRALEAAPEARILLVDGYEPGTWSTDAWETVRDARAEVAASHPDRVRVFDMAAHWPSLAKDGSTSDGLMLEEAVPLHPNAEGNARMAEIFAELLTPRDD